jgi:phosphatidylethanolamine-binding protein (PEBP) family uncharacterized protein
MSKFIFAGCAFVAAIGLPITASAMGLSFSWGPTQKCFDPKSPPMTVSAVPAGTKKLRIHMTDLNAPDYPHGGGKVAYTGNGKLPYGAFRYRGPCPPSPHTYRMTVEALDGSGKVLATATAKKRFP